jgi:chromosomal replication initiation ATPase DnaA
MSYLGELQKDHVARQARLQGRVTYVTRIARPISIPPQAQAAASIPAQKIHINNLEEAGLSELKQQVARLEKKVEAIECAHPEVTSPILPIVRTVAKFYGVTYADLISARRTARVVRPRHVAFYLAKTLSLKSYPEIGRRIGNRDHTTALHAFKKIEAWRLIDPDLDQELIELTAALTPKVISNVE